MKTDKPENPYWELHDLLIYQKDYEAFKAVIVRFIFDNLIFDRICNINSIFQNEKQPKYRDAFIKVVKELVTENTFARYFDLTYSEDGEKFTFKKGNLIEVNMPKGERITL